MRSFTILFLAYFFSIASAWKPVIRSSVMQPILHRRLGHISKSSSSFQRRQTLNGEKDGIGEPDGDGMPVMPESAERAWADPIIQTEARKTLIAKYLEKDDITLEYAEKEVDEYLADYERSGQYCLNLAFSKQPGGISGDPNQFSLYIGALFLGFFGSLALKKLFGTI